MNRAELSADVERLYSGKTGRREDSKLVERLLREMTHGHFIDRMIQNRVGRPSEDILDDAIAAAIDYMKQFAAREPLPEVYRVKLIKMEPAMTRQDMADAIARMRSGQVDEHQRAEWLWRMRDDVPHADIDHLIFHASGLTPEQIVDEAVRRQIAHLRTLFRDGDPRRSR